MRKRESLKFRAGRRDAGTHVLHLVIGAGRWGHPRIRAGSQLFEDRSVKNIHLLTLHCSSLSGAPSASASSLHPPSSPFLSQYPSITSSPATVNISLSTRRLAIYLFLHTFANCAANMGVPKFFRWMSERYPAISQLIAENRIPEFDCLYVSYSAGSVHQAKSS